MTTKMCKCCRQELDLGCFVKDIKKPDGLQIYCKECRKQSRRYGIDAAKGIVEKKKDGNIAAPRTFFSREPYVPEKIYIREDGNSKIKSRGFLC